MNQQKTGKQFHNEVDMKDEKQENLVHSITFKILRGLKDRSGFDGWYGNLDDEIQLEIYDEIRGIIHEGFEKIK